MTKTVEFLICKLSSFPTFVSDHAVVTTKFTVEDSETFQILSIVVDEINLASIDLSLDK